MINKRVSVYRLQPVRYVFRKANKIILPGERKLTLYEVSKYLFLEVKYLRLQERAAAVTFNFLMAMPPTLLFLFSLVPYLPLKNTEQTLLHTIREISPNTRIYQSIRAIITDFIHTRHRDILSIGILMTLFYSSNGMMGLMKTFDKSFSLFSKNITLYKRRGTIRRRWTAIRLTIMMIAMSLVMLSVMVIQNKKLNIFIPKEMNNIFGVKLLSAVVLLLVVFTSISVIYKYGPSLTHKFKFFSAGAVFATAASLIGTLVFFFLVNHFLNYNKVYGSIGTLIAFMVWVWFNTVIILVGYELNVSILLGKLSKNVEPASPVPNEETHS
ncbi:MAG: YihY/virulence factor BrkB family protein [Bacteroidota bacterium]